MSDQSCCASTARASRVHLAMVSASSAARLIVGVERVGGWVEGLSTPPAALHTQLRTAQRSTKNAECEARAAGSKQRAASRVRRRCCDPKTRASNQHELSGLGAAAHLAQGRMTVCAAKKNDRWLRSKKCSSFNFWSPPVYRVSKTPTIDYRCMVYFASGRCSWAMGVHAVCGRPQSHPSVKQRARAPARRAGSRPWLPTTANAGAGRPDGRRHRPDARQHWVGLTQGSDQTQRDHLIVTRGLPLPPPPPPRPRRHRRRRPAAARRGPRPPAAPAAAAARATPGAA